MKLPTRFTAYWSLATGLGCLLAYVAYPHNHSQGAVGLAIGLCSLLVYGFLRFLFSRL